MHKSEQQSVPARFWKKLILMKRIYQDPRLPKKLKFIPGLVIAYLLSPIDIIPDFIPVLGYLDDLIIVGFLLWLFFRLVPGELVEYHRVCLESEQIKPFDLKELTGRKKADTG